LSQGDAQERAARFAAAIARHVRGGSDILEIGAGEGSLATLLASAGHRVVAIDPLAAHQIFSEAGENLRRRLTPKQRARVDEVEEMRRAGTATDVDLRERWTILWPQYFADPTAAAPPAGYSIGVDCSRDTNASILEHFERGTLLAGLASVELPVLFVHGARDPMPLWSVEQTAAIVPGAELVVIPGCGHFPWWEAPGEIERAVAAFLAARG